MAAKLEGAAGAADAHAARTPEDDHRQRAHEGQRDERLDEVSGVGGHENGERTGGDCSAAAGARPSGD